MKLLTYNLAQQRRKNIPFWRIVTFWPHVFTLQYVFIHCLKVRGALQQDSASLNRWRRRPKPRGTFTNPLLKPARSVCVHTPSAEPIGRTGCVSSGDACAKLSFDTVCGSPIQNCPCVLCRLCSRLLVSAFGHSTHRVSPLASASSARFPSPLTHPLESLTRCGKMIHSIVKNQLAFFLVGTLLFAAFSATGPLKTIVICLFSLLPSGGGAGAAVTQETETLARFPPREKNNNLFPWHVYTNTVRKAAS